MQKHSNGSNMLVRSVAARCAARHDLKTLHGRGCRDGLQAAGSKRHRKVPAEVSFNKDSKSEIAQFLCAFVNCQQC